MEASWRLKVNQISYQNYQLRMKFFQSHEQNKTQDESFKVAQMGTDKKVIYK